MGRHALVGVQNEHHPEFQPLGAVHGHEMHALLPELPGSRLLLQFPPVILHVRLPLLQRGVGHGALLELVQHLPQLLGVQLTFPRVFPQVIIVSHRLADIVHRLAGGQTADVFQVVLQLLHPLHHPLPVLVKGFHRFQGDGLSVQGVTADVPYGPVDDPQQVCPAHVPCRSPQIGQNIPGDPVFIEIRQFVPHVEGNIVLHQYLHQAAGADVGPVQHGDVLVGHAQAHVVPQLGGDGPGLRPRIGELLCHHGVTRPADRRDILGKTGFFVADQLSGRSDDLRGGAVILIQKNLLGSRVILLKSQHDLRPGSPEPVYGLVVVAHDKQVVLRQGHHADHLILDAVDILEFID